MWLPPSLLVADIHHHLSGDHRSGTTDFQHEVCTVRCPEPRLEFVEDMVLAEYVRPSWSDRYPSRKRFHMSLCVLEAWLLQLFRTGSFALRVAMFDRKDNHSWRDEEKRVLKP